jgi:hypothetical protein
MAFGGSHAAYIARCKLGGYKGGPKRAAYWRALGFPNLARARIARWEPRRLEKLEEWKREELQRTRYALLDNPPEELRPVKQRTPKVLLDDPSDALETIHARVKSQLRNDLSPVPRPRRPKARH